MKVQRMAYEMGRYISEEDLAKLIAETSGYPWRWWQQPTLLTPRLWKTLEMLNQIKVHTTKYHNELNRLLKTGKFISDLQLACQAVPRPLTIALFCTLLLWAAEYSFCGEKEETWARCKSAAKVLYSLLQDRV
ncbi:LH2 [Snake adenovirus 1]|uniref:Protein LH2 n=1 Tax=Snake adenovirus serotype 1 TaxID=189830 RepID=LH2_ADES1|nr:LH2 [Snake adenovirus 1]A9CB84.1 RecName: Full=Protein LH2 [Snake adenovirus 1]ABA47234.1 LH2 [Snake adenovirus 1]